jgi:hypothetical protein
VTKDCLDPMRVPLMTTMIKPVIAEAESATTGAATVKLREFLTRLLEEYVDDRPGYVVLTGLAHLGEVEAGIFCMAASRAVGQLLPQSSKGTYLRRVADRGVRVGDGRTGRYSDSRYGGSLHTDGPHFPFPAPECFSLFCVRQAAEGGDLILVYVDEIVARLHKQERAILSKNFYFDRRDAAAPQSTVIHPILANDHGAFRMCYLREYIEIGHSHGHVPDLTPEQCRAMDAVDVILENPQLQHIGRLRPGEMLFVNNQIFCHGRTTFVDGQADGQRLLLRTWIRRRRRRPIQNTGVTSR